MSNGTVEQIVWGILAVAAGIIILSLGLQGLTQGAPLAEWAPSIALGILFLLAYFAPKLASRIEKNRSETNRLSLVDWTHFIVFTAWVVVGLVLTFAGFEMTFGIVKVYIFLGVIGIGAALYGLIFATPNQ